MASLDLILAAPASPDHGETSEIRSEGYANLSVKGEFKSPQATNKMRVKLYEQRNDDWVDKGTGWCTASFMKNDPRVPVIIVESEDQPKHLLLEAKIKEQRVFKKEQETLIVWQNSGSGADMALSFADAEGCAIIWEFISNIQQKSHGDPDSLDMDNLAEPPLPGRDIVMWGDLYNSNDDLNYIMPDLTRRTTPPIGGPQILLEPTNHDPAIPYSRSVKEALDGGAKHSFSGYDWKGTNKNEAPSSPNTRSGKIRTLPRINLDGYTIPNWEPWNAEDYPPPLPPPRFLAEKDEAPAHEEGQDTVLQIDNALQAMPDRSLEDLPTDSQREKHPTPSVIDAGAGPPTDSGYASLMQPGYSKRHEELEVNGNESLHKSTEVEFDDTATEYTSASSVPTIKRGAYIEEFADDLFKHISDLQPDIKNLERISVILPDLLKAFALRLGYNAPTQMHRDVMYFVHKYRRLIATAFKDRGLQPPESPVDDLPNRSDKMPLQELIGSWFEKQYPEEITPPLNTTESPDISHVDQKSDSESDPEEEEHEAENARFSTHGEFVVQSQAFQWLWAKLRMESRLAFSEPDIMNMIGQKILDVLKPSQRISRKSPSETFRAIFVVDWNILSFLQSQKYAIEPCEAISRVITLTGTCQDAQALTCAEYLKQKWPSTGASVMQLIKTTLDPRSPHRNSCYIRDETKLIAWIDRSIFTIEASGIAASIAEVGEQLAWLGAALRISPEDSGLVYCTPFLAAIHQNVSCSLDPEKPQIPDVKFTITFTMDQVNSTPNIENGRCWHDMFLNPVIVRGYPILKKQIPNSGIEMPLNLMAGLSQANQVDRFGTKTFIKGFSTLLVLTEKCQDVLLWHLVYNKNGNRISYLDNSAGCSANVGSLDLSNLRHIVGWCSEARFFAGSAETTYPVGTSGLPRPSKNCVFTNLSVSPGRGIVEGAPFVLGIKDRPAHLSRSGYIPKLQWIASKFVLLWDEADKRGWLVNGTSALLYVVRASLDHNSKDKFKAAFIFKEDQLEESPNPFIADSAIDVLINPKNLSLQLYQDYNGFLSFQSRIEYYFGILEKPIDHQSDIAGEDGIGLADNPRGKLEGWDFKDLATNRDPLYPRVASLKSDGRSWVDFTRSIHAVTLFGRGFGELIRPATTDICDYWAELPKQKYYIAACFSDLMQLVEGNDFYDDNHIRLSKDCIWHSPTAIFGSCRCRGILGPNHSEPVQTLLPSGMLNLLLPRKLPLPQDSRGAVIFGQNSSFSWVWGDHGDPEVGTVSSFKESDADSVNDSGIGISPMQSVSERSLGMSRSSTSTLVRSTTSYDVESVFSDPSAPGREVFTQEDYTVGILCALPKELLAVRALFDKKHDSLDNDTGDSNHYSLGQMQKHMVVAACLPAGEYGTNPAASSASNMRRSFPNIRFCLLVGIGGGVPSAENDIRLGDVVVSSPTASYSGVIQYDRGKENENSDFEMTGALQPPPRFLMTAISALTSNPDLPCNPLELFLKQIMERIPHPRNLKYKHPGQQHDKFFLAPCQKCQMQDHCDDRNSHLQNRSHRPTDEPEIHYGLIASGNRVIEDAKVRDEWARKHGVMCFEMEAAGIMNTFPSLVIRGICDYCDSYKNKLWQEYAAATAASYAKLLLGEVAPFENSHKVHLRKGGSASPYGGLEAPSRKRPRI